MNSNALTLGAISINCLSLDAQLSASIRLNSFVDRVINVWNALPSTVNLASLNVLGTALKRLISPVLSFVIFYLCDRICIQ